MPRLRKPCPRIAHEVGVLLAFQQHLLHALEHARVDIPCNLAKIRGNLALYLRDLESVALVVDLLYHPHVAGKRYALANGWRLHNGSQLL